MEAKRENQAEPTVVIDDDNPENLALLAKLQKSRSYRVLPARDGRLGLGLVRSNQPDIVLSDIMMPDLDGFEICRQLKKDPATRDIPVVFLTALQESENKLKEFEPGGLDYITKPFCEEDAQALVRAH